MAAKSLPDQSTPLQLLRYEPGTGKLFWKERPASMFQDSIRLGKVRPAAATAATWNKGNAGNEAFTQVLSSGHRHGAVWGNKLLAHRVIWKLAHGTEPLFIDHINGDPGDNRIANLRSVTTAGNGQNRKRGKNNTSGAIGVNWNERRRKWRSTIRIGQRTIHIGHYDTFDEAVAARKAAEVQHGFHPNHGRNQEEPLHGQEAEGRA